MSHDCSGRRYPQFQSLIVLVFSLINTNICILVLRLFTWKNLRFQTEHIFKYLYKYWPSVCYLNINTCQMKLTLLLQCFHLHLLKPSLQWLQVVPLKKPQSVSKQYIHVKNPKSIGFFYCSLSAFWIKKQNIYLNFNTYILSKS